MSSDNKNNVVIDPKENARLLAELSESMASIAPPPASAEADWTSEEIQLYFSSGGYLKPSAYKISTRKKAMTAVTPPSLENLAISPNNSSTASVSSSSSSTSSSSAPSATVVEYSKAQEQFPVVSADIRSKVGEASKLKNYGLKWIVGSLPNTVKPTASFRVFLFPQVGAASPFFAPLMKKLNDYPEIEALCAALPARGPWRTKEAPMTSLEKMAKEFVDEVGFLFQEKPCILFGHSFGALFAYAVAIEIRNRGLPLPRHLIISSRPPPSWIYKQPYHTSPDATIIDFMKDGTPAAVLNEPDLMKIFLPVVRSDYQANETYTKDGNIPSSLIDVPFTLCNGGPTDRTTLDPPIMEAIGEWSQYTSKGVVSSLNFTDGHFWPKVPAAIDILSQYMYTLCR